MNIHNTNPNIIYYYRLPKSTTKLRWSIRACVEPNWEDDNKPPDDILPGTLITYTNQIQ
jgi:hypothetical protein